MKPKRIRGSVEVLSINRKPIRNGFHHTRRLHLNLSVEITVRREAVVE
jgi:hypothetical protein